MKTRYSTKKIIVHHSVTDPNIDKLKLRAIFKARFQVGYIGYNICIRPNGSIISDIGDDGWGIHNATGEFNNSNSVGVCVLGTFSQALPPNSQLNGLERELERLMAKYGLGRDDIIGHRDTGKATACPGAKLYGWLNEFKKGETVDCTAERMNARADALRFAWESWNPGKKVDMDSIYKDAEAIEVGKLNQKELILGWMKKSLGDINFVVRKEYVAITDKLDGEIEMLEAENNAIQLKLLNALKNFTVCTEKLDKKADQLSVTDHLRALGRAFLIFVAGNKE